MVLNTPSAVDCGLSLIEEHHLQAKKEELVLCWSGSSLLSWPYKHIRRYGMEGNSFKFEAGTKCDSGEGRFSFRCIQPGDAAKLFSLVRQAMYNIETWKQGGT